jgi:hypothetical protein
VVVTSGEADLGRGPRLLPRSGALEADVPLTVPFVGRREDPGCRTTYTVAAAATSTITPKTTSPRVRRARLVAWRASKPGSRLASDPLPTGPLLGELNASAP